MTVIFQLTKIQNFLADYAVELASTDFEKIYSKKGAVQYEDYTVSPWYISCKLIQKIMHQ